MEGRLCRCKNKGCHPYKYKSRSRICLHRLRNVFHPQMDILRQEGLQSQGLSSQHCRHFCPLSRQPRCIEHLKARPQPHPEQRNACSHKFRSTYHAKVVSIGFQRVDSHETLSASLTCHSAEHSSFSSHCSTKNWEMIEFAPS